MKFVFTLLFFGAVTLGISQQHVIVLGVAQDGGFPHIGCFRACRLAHSDPTLSKYVVSLALVDSVNKKWWLFEATPDMDRQLQYFQDLTNQQYPYLPEGIFLTHAHIGHYTGLMFLGREALGAKGIKVYAIQCGQHRITEKVFKEMAQLTGGVYLRLGNIHDLVDLLIGVCMREVGLLMTFQEQLRQFLTPSLYPILLLADLQKKLLYYSINLNQ